MAQFYGNFAARTVVENCMNIPTTWTALPTIALAGRAMVEVYNKSDNKLYLSFDNTVTTVKYRTAIGNGELRSFPIQDNITLYGRTGNGSTRVIVTEYK